MKDVNTILPAVYTVEQIQTMLMISRSAAYALANSGEIPVVKIGRSIRIPMDAFDKWLDKVSLN